MAIELKNVFFGKRNSPSSAVAPMRINLGQERSELGGGPATEQDPRKSPIVVITGMLPNDPIELEAEFEGPRDEGFRVTIESHFKSLAENENGNDAVFGSVSNVHCVFGADGKAKQRLTLGADDDAAKTRLTSVVYGDVILEWTMKPDNGGEAQHAETTHRLYTLLAPPGSPWSADFTDPHRWVWTDVLEFACIWAAGATTLDDVADRITAKVHGLGFVDENQGGLRYDSGPRYTIDDVFECDEFLQHLNKQQTRSLVNCSDLATIVSTFSNALGCRLLQARCSEGKTKPILVIGSKEPKSMDFLFHEVVWDGATLKSDRVWDACTAVSGEVGPARHAIFSAYSRHLYGRVLGTQGPPFTTNRMVTNPALPGRDPQTLPRTVGFLARPVNTAVHMNPMNVATPREVTEMAAASPLSEDEEPFADLLNQEETQKEIGPDKKLNGLYDGEKRLEWKIPVSGLGRVSARLSSFNDREEAWRFLKIQLAKLSERFQEETLVEGVPGRIFLSKQRTTLFYQVGKIVITARVDGGKVDLPAEFKKLLVEWNKLRSRSAGRI